MQAIKLFCATCIILYLCLTEIQSNETLAGRLAKFNPELSLSSGERFGLQHFTYNNSGVVDLVFDALEETNFTGITVSIYSCNIVLVSSITHHGKCCMYVCQFVTHNLINWKSYSVITSPVAIYFFAVIR